MSYFTEREKVVFGHRSRPERGRSTPLSLDRMKLLEKSSPTSAQAVTYVRIVIKGDPLSIIPDFGLYALCEPRFRPNKANRYLSNANITLKRRKYSSRFVK